MGKHMRVFLCVATVTTIVTVSSRSAGAEETKAPAALKLGAHRQLFLDDFVIDEMTAIRRNVRLPLPFFPLGPRRRET